MKRLLFAAARGARLQSQHFKDHPNYWEAARIVRLGDHDKIDSDYVWRIHPDDAHRQYGPISTEFRTLAKNPPPSTSGGGPVVKEYINRYKAGDELYLFMQDADKSLFLLLISEVLADDGL
jgi:hypothetical protein